MSDYLFPITRRGIPMPFHYFLTQMLPSARHAILMVDPFPPGGVLRAMMKLSNPGLKTRLLVRPPGALTDDPHTGGLLHAGVVRKLLDAGIDIRVKPGLSPRIYVVDDSCLVISGDGDSDSAFGIVLEPSDSQHIIDHWESLFRKARRLNISRIDRTLEQLVSRAAGGDEADRLVNIINRRGAFIDIHVKLFQDCRPLTIRPFREFDVEGAGDRRILWRRLPPEMFQRFHRVSGRIRNLKFRSYVLTTPAGQFLPEKHRGKWESAFAERKSAFLRSVADAIDDGYDALRKKALESLRAAMIEIYRDVSGKTSLLPIVTREDFIRYGDSLHASHFPSRERLNQSCNAWFVRYGLHPDALEDSGMMLKLTRLTLQAELL